uniref:Uncharacterized protein n=1 Tax=Chelonoidis abingdonii TaxID=106734 RepID=A0A8C0HCB6_CHEAB
PTSVYHCGPHPVLSAWQQAPFIPVVTLKAWLLLEKRGVLGVFYKAAVLSTRLHAVVPISCIVMAFYVLFIK